MKNFAKFLSKVHSLWTKAQKYFTAIRILIWIAIVTFFVLMAVLMIPIPGLQARMESTKGTTYVTNTGNLYIQMEIGNPYLTYWYPPKNMILFDTGLDSVISHIPVPDESNSDAVQFLYSCTTPGGQPFPGRETPGLGSSKSWTIKYVQVHCDTAKPWQLEYGFAH